MVSDKYKCIFVEVPKTGSTSVRAILGPALKPHLNLWEIKTLMESYWPVRADGMARWREVAYLALPKRRRAEIGGRKFREYFKFGFVRNPWDRMVSLYERKEATEMRTRMTFAEFVRWIEYSSATCVHSSPHRYQLDWFVDPDGNVLADFIGRFEKLKSDWRVVADKLGIAGELPHVRENPRARHYTEYYDEETRELVRRKFRVDIERFEYEFGA